MRSDYFASSFAVCAVCTGCTSIQSKDIKTDGMSAYLRVQADGSGQSTASAQLNVDNNPTDFVDLSTGDTLVATAGSQSDTMSRSDILGAVTYQATFSGEDAEGTLYTIAFNRTSDVSAPSSTCTMPGPFSITAPTSSGSFSRANTDLSVTYSGGGTSDAMSWSVSGGCVTGQSGEVSNDAGSFTIAKGLLVVPSSQANASQTCTATLTLTRQRPGQIDSHYGSGGSIVATQVRSVTFNSTP